MLLASVGFLSSTCFRKSTSSELQLSMSDFNESLISLVQARPLLYNSSLPNYKHDKIKANIWKKISESLHTDVDACKRRWRSLRNKYCKEAKAQKNLEKSGSSAVILKKWRYFELMSFLQSHIQPKETVSNVPFVQAVDEFSENCETFSSTLEVHIAATDENNLATPVCGVEPKPLPATKQNVQGTLLHSAEATSAATRKKRELSEEDKLLAKAISASTEAMNAMKQREKPDAASKFAEVVAEKLRALDNPWEVELKILEVLNAARNGTHRHICAPICTVCCHDTQLCSQLHCTQP